MHHIYFPYTIGSDSPIAYLYQSIASKLDSDQFSITVLRNNQDTIIDAPNVTELYGYKQQSMRRYLTHVRASLRAHDLIHTGGYPHLRYLMSRLTQMRNIDIKHVHSLRVDIDPEGPYQTNKKRKLVELADIVTAVSEHTAETARKHLDVSPKVIYNGVNADLFQPDIPEPKFFDEVGIENPILLYVGSFERRKRPHAVVEVAKSQDYFNVLMIGNGSLYEQIKRIANNVDNLYVPGRVKKRKLPAIYANSTGMLFPSVREGCPNVVLEAMAAGLPVVGYQATSMPELVDHGKNGYLVKRDDLTALLDAIDQLSDPVHCHELGYSARKYIEKHHRFDNIVSQYESVYDSILS